MPPLSKSPGATPRTFFRSASVAQRLRSLFRCGGAPEVLPTGTDAPPPAELPEPAEAAARRATARQIFANGSLPTNFSINLGAAPCNHSCLFCPQSIKKPKKAAWLDLDLLGKVIGEMPHQGVLINLSSYSEKLSPLPIFFLRCSC